MSAGAVLGPLVKYAPIILDMADRIYGKIKDAMAKQAQPAAGTRGESIPMSSLAERILRLESNELQQAELDSKIARQLSDITAVLQTVSRNAVISLVLGGLAILLSLVSVILTVTR